MPAGEMPARASRLRISVVKYCLDKGVPSERVNNGAVWGWGEMWINRRIAHGAHTSTPEHPITTLCPCTEVLDLAILSTINGLGESENLISMGVRGGPAASAARYSAALRQPKYPSRIAEYMTNLSYVNMIDSWTLTIIFNVKGGTLAGGAWTRASALMAHLILCV